MKKALAFTLALMMLPPSFVLYVALHIWEAWHLGPSQWMLNALRWLNYKAFKKPTAWVMKNTKKDVK